MKPAIFVTRKLPHAAMALLEENFQMECNPHDRVLLREELLDAVAGKEGILSLLTDTMDGEVMDSAGNNLKIIANYAVGFNNIDVGAATKRKIAVSNTPGVLTDTTADLAMALILAVARRIVESDIYTRAEKYMGWDPLLFMGSDVHHKTLGILGFGRVGQALAKRAAGFDMKILYHDMFRVDPEIEKKVGATYVDQNTLLKTSDYISIHVPLTPETTGLIDSDTLSLMKPSAFVINTARGEIIREADLVKALTEKKIAGAGLDVFENEPKIHPGLLKMNNVVILPHIGSASMETRTKMGLIAASNLIAKFKGEIPPNCLNPEIFES
ncbi:MAG: D-glycerate dehydrogenase [Deltaproteobacteria bacterium]|jgi:glyoxylate reductase|nr:D-glycerate dehydrogenase [Deltaproteobacteria bacterium]